MGVKNVILTRFRVNYVISGQFWSKKVKFDHFSHFRPFLLRFCKTTLYNFSDLLHRIPVNKMNPYNIMMEAGGQSFGVDDLRTHILSNLSQCHCSSLNCCLCDRKMPIYHHFPLVAGTLFLSSEKNEKSNRQGSRVQLQHNGKNTYRVILLKCQFLGEKPVLGLKQIILGHLGHFWVKTGSFWSLLGQNRSF